ncbi:hypothetical protein GCM10018954_066340 [Kutzneria kofuensis]
MGDRNRAAPDQGRSRREESWSEFRTELAVELRKVYPPRTDGTTWFPFRRVFAVAQVRR